MWNYELFNDTEERSLLVTSVTCSGKRMPTTAKPAGTAVTAPRRAEGPSGVPGTRVGPEIGPDADASFSRAWYDAEVRPDIDPTPTLGPGAAAGRATAWRVTSMR